MDESAEAWIILIWFERISTRFAAMQTLSTSLDLVSMGAHLKDLF